jgi:hypothetical protein
MHKRESTRKIEGHPGSAAAMYVSEAFGDFDIAGTLRARYAGMQREAGQGGHGITEGTILVDVELKPIRGMTQVVEVPVYVHDGYMQRPGLMYHQGSAMVIAQSAIDELMDQAKYGDRVETDRRHLFAPPKIDVKKASLEKEAAPLETYEVFEQLDARGPSGKGRVKVPDGSVIYLLKDMPDGSTAFGFNPDGPVAFVWEPGMLEELHSAGALAVDGHEAGLEAEAAPLGQRQMVEQMRPDDIARMQQTEQARALEEQKARQRMQQMNAPKPGTVVPIVRGRPVAGSLAKLACEICVPTNEEKTEGYKLPEGSRVFVTAVLDEGVSIKHESGIEAVVADDVLA